MVIKLLGRVRSKVCGQSEYMLETVVDPHLGRCGAQKIVVLCKQLPDFAPIRLCRLAVCARHTQCVQGNTLRKEHAKHIVIRRHEQFCRVRKCLILSKPARICVPVRANDWQVRHRGIKLSRDLSRGWICREQPVRIKGHSVSHEWSVSGAATV